VQLKEITKHTKTGAEQHVPDLGQYLRSGSIQLLRLERSFKQDIAESHRSIGIQAQDRIALKRSGKNLVDGNDFPI